MVADESISVRSCVASVLLAVSRYDRPLAVRLFKSLVSGIDERLLTSHYAEHFIYYMLVEFYDDMQPFIGALLHSTDEKASEAGSRLACIAYLSLINESVDAPLLESATRLVKEALSGSASQRKGAAVVAAKNIAGVGCRGWCEAQLLKLFNDDDKNVRDEAASCFDQLDAMPFESYDTLIEAFSHSAAFLDDSFHLLQLLEGSQQRLPGTTCVVCEMFLERLGDETQDINSRHFGDVSTVAKLIFRTYQQHQNDDWTSRCLDLIDRMCLERIRDVKKELDEFER